MKNLWSLGAGPTINLLIIIVMKEIHNLIFISYK